ELVARIWPDSQLSLARFDERTYADLFRYLKYSESQLRQYRQRFACETLESTVEIGGLLKHKVAEPLSAVLQNLSSQYLGGDPKALQRSIELSIRLWLTINVKSPSVAVGPTFPFEDPLEWTPPMSLASLIETRFGKSDFSGDSKVRVRLEGSFTAAYLVNICGMQIQWTDYLSDHLRHDASGRNLVVYRHKICLVNHLKSGDACPIPRDILTEALDTLNLLFPFGDAPTKQLLLKENQLPFYQLGGCGRARDLELSSYEYWREEVDGLLKSFRSPPKSWKQLATDRRDLKEYATFWIAVMVAVLTIVSIPCNIIQATYSVKAYRVSLAQVN
ncbi:hypothetical protein EJ04DRAFT_412869, partial [Polyplosphaeria fusca]